MSTIGIDFDGVIHTYSRGWEDGSIYDRPIAGAFATIRHLMDMHAVFVFTARDPEQHPAIAQWFSDYDFGLPVVAEVDMASRFRARFWNTMGTLLITQKKYPAIAYIDDRAIRFTNWHRVVPELQKLEML